MIEACADRFQYLCVEFGIRLFQDVAPYLSHIVDALNEEETENGDESVTSKDGGPILTKRKQIFLYAAPFPALHL